MTHWPRWLNRWYAETAGYFWLPCPRCGQMFGGHELGGTDWYITSSDDTGANGAVCCWRCPDDETLIGGYWRRGHWLKIANELAELRTWP